jgi:anti-sigma factor RsiW
MSEISCQVAAEYAQQARRGRLGDAEAEALGAHLATCAQCRELHRHESALDMALGRLERPVASEALKARLQGLVANDTAKSGRLHLVRAPGAVERRRGVLRLAVAAGLLAVAAALFLSFGQYHRSQQGQALLASEAVSDHLRILYADRGMEVESGGIHQVKPWFEGRLDFAPVLAFDGDDEFPLVGGSAAYFRDRKAAAFAFRHRLHRITLLVFRADGLTDLPSGNVAAGRAPGVRVRSRGFDVLLWQRDDLGYALVSDMTGSELDRLASKIATAK